MILQALQLSGIELIGLAQKFETQLDNPAMFIYVQGG